MKRLIHRMNQTAHISLQKPTISNSGETKPTDAPYSLARPPAWFHKFFAVTAFDAAPVRGYLRPGPTLRKGFFGEI